MKINSEVFRAGGGVLPSNGNESGGGIMGGGKVCRWSKVGLGISALTAQ